ncbi:MAG: DNA polymerase III subunit beta [Ignavibacteria bacterium]|nr:DNA polymerase III subunit beta [Ignavibacteria bacterium]
MQFSIDLKALNQALQKVIPALPRKSPIPALEHFYFHLDGDTLKIIASDQNVTIMSQVTVNPIEEGKVLVPGKKITDITKALEEGGEISFTSDEETYTISIKTTFGHYSMKGLDPEEYLELRELFQSEKPDISKLVQPLDEEAKINAAAISMKDLSWAAERTYFSVSTDDFKPALTGVFFQFQKDKVNLVSTDGYRLTRATIFSDTQNIFPSDLGVIIPARTVELLRKVDDDVLISFISDEKKITHTRFDIGNTVIITRVISENFPKYENVIPASNPHQIIVNKKEIIPALRRVALFASTFQKLVRCEISSNMITLTTEDRESGTQASETIPCEYNGTNFVVGFNYELLIEAINNIVTLDDSEQVYIYLSEASKPAILKPSQNEERLLMLLMPMRL